jgi:23S rRNA pseudouridine1911/1915/1917 synthase
LEVVIVIMRKETRWAIVGKQGTGGESYMVGRTEPDAEGAAPEGSDAAGEGEDEGPETRSANVGEEQHGERLDKIVVALAPEFSRSHLQGLIRSGQVSVDGIVVAAPARRLRAGQHLAVTLLPTAESRAYRAEALPLVVVHEDEDLLVVDKAAGMVVHPAAGHWSGTLLNALLARDPASAALPRAGIVHRLDKDTSGLMVVGKTLPAVTGLVRAIAAREVHRRYLAIAQGRPAAKAFTIDAPIGRDPQTRTRMAVVASGKSARTDVEWLASGDGLSALRCTLHTGRTHQIRVHLASRGLPLVGDRLYGGRPALGIERQALHAAELAFAHPISGRAHALGAALPVDLAGAWQHILGMAPR